MRNLMLKLLIFTCLGFGNLAVQAANPNTPQSVNTLYNPPFEQAKAYSTEKKTSKKQKWIQKFAKKHGGYEALFYIFLAIVIDIVLAIVLILSLIFGWKLAAWITGIILAAQLLILMVIWIADQIKT